jgi:5S rRNA maturation endonuclease (ribonuclease M5)/archaellum biogenesis ATPase FlaH
MKLNISPTDIKNYYASELESFKPSKGSSNQATARCPFHADKKPSLSVDLETGRFKCHAGSCRTEGNIITFHTKRHGMKTKNAYKALVEKIGPEGGAMAARRTTVDTYDYLDADSNLLYRKVRYEPKGFSLERPDGNGGWVNGLNGAQKVLYNLPEVVKAKNVLVVEGEKDVETLKRLGLTPKRDYAATTNPMGAGEKWEQGYANYLKGKNVVILPDNDEAGRKHAENVATNLAGLARSVKILKLPGLEEKGDVTDWVAMNGGYKDKKNRKALRKNLLRLIEQAKPFKFITLFSQLLKASDLRKMNKQVQWVIDKIIPQHSVTLLHGSGGIGKTWLAMMMAEKVARGKSFLGCRTKKLRAIYVDFENSLELASDRANILSMSKVRFFHNGSLPKPPRLDANDWEKYKTLPKNSLLIIDTLRASQGFDENSSKDMAFVFNRLKELRDLGFTIVVLHHTPKSNKKTYKGSTAILDLADHVLSLHKNGTSDNSGGGAISDDEDSGKKNTFEFCTMEKTRYEPFRVCLQLKKDVGFMLAPDPSE